MNTKAIFLLCISIIFALHTNAQESSAGKWNNHKCAVVLTYDDCLNVHLDKVIPALDSLGLKATFYNPGYSEVLYERMDEWKIIAKNGHELGNHTLFHPCIGKSQGRDWVKPDYDLDNYTIKRMVDEIEASNTLLKAMDDKTERTFAYTCGDKSAGDSVFVGLIRKDFIAARGAGPKMEQLDSIDLFDIGSYIVNEKTSYEMIDLVKQAHKKHALLVFLFHGVGGGHNINVELNEHNKLLEYLKANENEIWVAPLVDVAKYIKEFSMVQK